MNQQSNDLWQEKHSRNAYDIMVSAPLYAGSKTFQIQSMPSFLNLANISSAILEKLSVARAKIVGPAPERHMPSKPGWEDGVTDASMSGRAGI